MLYTNCVKQTLEGCISKEDTSFDGEINWDNIYMGRFMGILSSFKYTLANDDEKQKHKTISRKCYDWKYITCTYLFVFNKYLINIFSRIVYYWKCLLVFVKCPLPVFILTKHKQKLCDDCVVIVICNDYLLYLINCVSSLARNCPHSKHIYLFYILICCNLYIFKHYSRNDAVIYMSTCT